MDEEVSNSNQQQISDFTHSVGKNGISYQNCDISPLTVDESDMKNPNLSTDKYEDRNSSSFSDYYPEPTLTMIRNQLNDEPGVGITRSCIHLLDDGKLLSTAESAELLSRGPSNVDFKTEEHIVHQDFESTNINSVELTESAANIAFDTESVSLPKFIKNETVNSASIIEHDSVEPLSEPETTITKLAALNNIQQSKKKRRRIVLMDDGENSDESGDRMSRDDILKSPSPNLNIIPDILDIGLLDDGAPKPKSKKASTKLLKEMEARALLQSAVIIPVLDNDMKRKKIRILESDDECAVETNLKGIGIDYTDDDPLSTSSYEQYDHVIGSTLLLQRNEIRLCKIELFQPEEDIPLDLQCCDGSDDDASKSRSNYNEFHQNTLSDCSIGHNNSTASKVANREKNKPRSSKKLKSRNGERDPFADITISSSEEEYQPNDIYFGDQDRTVKQSSRSSRGYSKVEIEKKATGYNCKTKRSKLIKKSRRRTRSSSSSSDISDNLLSNNDTSDSDDWKKQSNLFRKKTRPVVSAPKKIYHPIPSYPKKEKKKKKKKSRDRFFDKSRLIPDNIYFGDVDVPLHVLHAYGATSDSASISESENIDVAGFRYTIKHISSCGRTQQKVTKKSRKCKSRYSSASISPDRDDLINTMKNYLKVAGINKVKFNKLWEGCKSNEEKVNAILKLLHEKGLQGEPTISKCRELKKQIQTKKEIEDLDVSAIITTEGRTRRSSTRRATSRSYVEEDDILTIQTMDKIKQVIDSDSDN